MALEDPSEKPSGAAKATQADSEPCGRLLSTGDMARLSENTLRTVRFYEEEGLLCVSRSDGGHRLFENKELQKLKLITDLREAGLSLQEIRDLLAIKSQCSSAHDASTRVCTALEGRIDEMQRKIALLRRLRDELSSTLAVLRECDDCGDTRFPKGCGDCEVMAREDLPRAAKLLWKK